MILKTLHLKNFRKFKDTIIDFPDGVTSIIGFNGTGKSTIFEAIAWTLYGTVAARTPADQIKRINTEPKEPCRVELEFIFNEDTYRVVREMTGKNLTASATATVNGKLAVNGTEPTNKYIQKKLGLDFKSFFTSIFARQKELNALSTINASERRPLILKMLGVDSLDEILTEIRSDKREKKHILEKLQDELIDENGQEKKIKYEIEIKQLKEKKEQIQKQKKEIKQKLQQLENNVKIAEKKYNKIKKEYETTKKQKEEYAEKKIKYDKKKQLKDTLEKLRNTLNERKRQIEKQKNQLKKIDKKKLNLKEIEQQQKKIEQNINELIKKSENKKTKINQLENDIKEIQEKKTNIEKMGPSSKCPTCEKILGNQHSILIEQFTKTIKEKNQQTKIFKDQIKEEQKKYDQILLQKQALQKKYSYTQSILVEQEKTTTMIQGITREINKEENEKKHIEQQLKQLDIIDFNEKQFQELKDKVENIYNALQKTLETVGEQKKNLSDQKIFFEKHDGEYKLIQQKILTIEEKKKQLEKFKKRLKTEQNVVKDLGMLQEIMASFRTYLISRIRPTLSSYASALFEQLTDGKYHEIELDENYNLMVYEDGEPYKIERFSGGEEDLANLCIRLAISEVITERAGSLFHVLVLDEIFGSQDNIRRQNIIQALNNLSSKFKQIFLITHIDEIKNYMENTITVIEDENSISTIKIE